MDQAFTLGTLPVDQRSLSSHSVDKLRLQGDVGSKPKLIFEEEELSEVNRLNRLNICVTPGDHISDEVPLRTQRAGLALTSLRHL